MPTPLTHSLSDSGLVFPSSSPSAQAKGKSPATNVHQIVYQLGSMPTLEREDFIYHLLSSLPRSQLSALHRRIAPLLLFDVVSSLPTEVALQIFSHLPAHTILECSLVSKRWNILANDQILWRKLCHAHGWEWHNPTQNPDALDPAMDTEGSHPGMNGHLGLHGMQVDDEDEGMGDLDDDIPRDSSFMMGMDSGFASGSTSTLPPPSFSSSTGPSNSIWAGSVRNAAYIHSLQRSRHSVPVKNTPLPSSPSISRSHSSSVPKPDFKRLYRTHTHLRNRFLTSSYRFSVIQTRGSPPNGHSNMIYCVQLYTYPTTHQQVIFTGSRDKSIREWDLQTGEVERVFEGVHTESVLSLCVRNGWMVSAGSDRRVVLWKLDKGRSETAVVKVLKDHVDSVLCVRFDDEKLVSCSKDQTIRVYSFPDLELVHILRGHRAAVNAISLYKNFVVSASGDRSMNVWDVRTGKLLRTFEDHHTRGIASIDFKHPYIVSGSSDKHIRLIDINTLQGWSTSPDYDDPPLGHVGTSLPPIPLGPDHIPFLPRQLYPRYLYGISDMCHSCGSIIGESISTNAVASSSSAIPLTHSQSLPVSHQTPSNSYSSFLPRRIASFFTSPSSHPHTLSPHPSPTTSTTPTVTQHSNLVRSVALGPDFIITGSYDLSVKIWDRMTGILVSDLKGGHTGKIFCVAADRTKVVSCGEDMRICVWDFSSGVEGVESIKREW